jgi:hypothetical protein
LRQLDSGRARSVGYNRRSCLGFLWGSRGLVLFKGGVDSLNMLQHVVNQRRDLIIVAVVPGLVSEDHGSELANEASIEGYLVYVGNILVRTL